MYANATPTATKKQVAASTTNTNMKEFTADEMAKIEQQTSKRTFEKKNYIYYPQEPSKNIYFLKSGKVKIGTYSGDGKEVIKAIVYPGQMFGEMGLVGEEKRSDFAKCMNQNVEVSVLNIDDLRSIVSHDPQLNIKIMTLIGNRLRMIERRLESLIFKSARSRIIDLLTDIANERGLKVGYEVLLRNFLSHKEIAAMTGTSRQTVTKVLSELKRANLIHTDRKNILIRDLSKLV